MFGRTLLEDRHCVFVLSVSHGVYCLVLSINLGGSEVKCSSFHHSALSGSDKKSLLDVTSVKKKNKEQPQKSIVSVAEFVFSPVDDLLCLLPSLEGCNDTLEALQGLRPEDSPSPVGASSVTSCTFTQIPPYSYGD